MEMTKEVAEIIDKVKFTYHKSPNQTAHMFSEWHTKFVCKITYKGKSFQSNYQCNVGVSDMNNIKLDFMDAVFDDKDAYDFSRDDKEFAFIMGCDYYEDRKEVDRCYKGCMRASKGLGEMFNPEELEILGEFFRDY